MKVTRALRIAQIEYELPARVVSNRDFALQFPEWSMAALEEKSGIRGRHIAGDNETAFDLAREASRRLLARAGFQGRDVDGIVFCTQTPDYIMPSNAFLLHEALGMRRDALAFDYNLACSGYVYGLAIIQGLVETGLAERVLLVTADTYSKYINERDRAARTLFGDGAAATLVEAAGADSLSGLIDVALASAGESHRFFLVPAGGARTPRSEETRAETTDESGNTRSLENIHMNGFAVWRFVATEVPKQIAQLLARNGLGVKDIDLYVFHQASKLTLDSLIAALRIPREKVFINMECVGNTVSASIPIALADAAACGVLERGHLVLLSGFGVGLSWASALMRY